MDERRYVYRPQPWKLFAGVVLFGAGAIVLSHEAWNNDRGMLINHMIRLDPSSATVFLWVLTATAVAIVAGALAQMPAAISGDKELVLDRQGLTIPKNFGEDTRVTYGAITSATVRTFKGQRFLYLRHRAGTARVVASMLPSQDDFDEVCALIAKAASAQHSHPGPAARPQDEYDAVVAAIARAAEARDANPAPVTRPQGAGPVRTFGLKTRA